MDRDLVTTILDMTATVTSFWRTKPSGVASQESWECTQMVWSEEANAWLAKDSYTGNTPHEARLAAVKSIQASV